MKIKLYRFNKRINSTKVPDVNSKGGECEIKLKDGCSILNPSLTLSEMDPTPYNYIDFLDHYYYIDDIILLRDNLWLIKCSMDVLASYRTEILQTSAFVNYSSNIYDSMIPDSRLSSNPNASVKISTKELIYDSSIDDGTYLFSYITDKPNYGMSGVIWADQITANNISKCINSAGMDDFLLNDLKKQLSNTNQAIRSCRYLPMVWYDQKGDTNYNPPNVPSGGGGSGGNPNPDGFTPRLSATPEELRSLIYYSNPINPLFPANAPTSVGGYLNNRGNCTWYAWGRFWEICGAKNPPKLPAGNASSWYPTATGYSRGQKPKVGAVACWGTPNVEFGHVAIVEKTYDNGDFTVSNSSWTEAGGQFFFTHTLQKANNYYFDGAGVFQGFIYNSCVKEDK